jgi:hypothetical protein
MVSPHFVIYLLCLNRREGTVVTHKTMGDSASETVQQLTLQKRRDDEEYARDKLSGCYLHLDQDSIPCVMNVINYFVSQSRGNESVKQVYLYPYAFNVQDDEVWDKIGQAIGNFQSLDWLCIFTTNYLGNDNEDDDLPNPEWEILQRILRHVRQRITLVVTSSEDEDEAHVSAWRADDIRSFIRAIHGHPTITRFKGGDIIPEEYMDALYSALATLPALESLIFSNTGRQVRPEDESTIANHESLTELLRVPSLRSIWFDYFSFTPTLCQATANALMKGTAVTKLDFRECSFSVEASIAMMTRGLAKNTSVISISAQCNNDRALFGVLAAVLPSHSTLQHLELGQRVPMRRVDDVPDIDAYLPLVFSALGKNTGLKTLLIGVPCSMDESLSIAMKDGLELNETLENLELINIHLTDDNADFWCRALSFLHTNKGIKSLKVNVQQGIVESCLATFRIDVAAMLQESASLECLSILTWNAIKTEEYIALLTALQHNLTLKTVRLHLIHSMRLQLNDDQSKEMAVLLKKNYALEKLPDIDQKDLLGDLGAILRLNEAGRRYLIQDGSSISKGVEVLIRVNNDINCVFLHLLENPRLCDRRAVEMVSTGVQVDESVSW